MIVARLFRHPVKSVSGEEVDAVDVDRRGVVGDRTWAVYTDDGGIGSGKNSTRFRKVDGLLHWASELPDGADGPVLVSPEGNRHPVGSGTAAEALTAAFGRPLVPRAEGDVLHFDDSALHVVTTSSLRALAAEAGGGVDVRRLRANVLVDTDADGWVEDGWLGHDLALGDEVVLRVTEPMPRCVMVDMSHRAVDAEGPRILKPLGRVHDVELGVQAEVVSPGRLRVGDVVRLL